MCCLPQQDQTALLHNTALIQPESRQAFARMLSQDWTDALRKLRLDGPLWVWDYKRNRWPADKECGLIISCSRRLCGSAS
jgi:exonuclease III